MEQEFYRDEFEQLLKDTTDDFKMYPSRKVWHSIYNDLHPDRKWPSFAVCLLLLTTILYVGVTNNNTISSNSKKNAASLSLLDETMDQPSQNEVQSSGKLIAMNNYPQNNSTVGDISQAPSFPVLAINDDTREQPVEEENAVPAADATTSTRQPANTSPASFEEAHLFTANANSKISVSGSVAVPGEANEKTSGAIAGNEVLNTNSDPVADENAGNTAAIKTGLNTLLAGSNKTAADTKEREWIEDFAFHNKSNAAAGKLFKGLSTQFYITPSVGYRILFRNNNHQNIDNSLVTNNATLNSNEKVELNQQAAVNMEAGFGITKDLGKRLRFKTGLQFNYTDYITNAQRLEHPIQTSLVVNSQGAGVSLAAYSADYAHIPGKNTSKIHNSTVQLSIPLGMDYKILSNRMINWYVGATVQPTLVTRSNAYLLSSDNNYFVQEQAMLRKWNLNGAVESFVSFKTPSGTFINLGPQFRYQLFSSYSKTYSFTEKPYSIGFKIGFTRPL